MLFFLIILIALYVNANNKVQDQQRELEKIQREYAKEDINEVYQEELIGNDGISTIGYDKENGVNKPKLTSSTDENTGLIPIKWTGTNWVVCTEDDPEWYNYSAEDVQVTAEDGTTQTVPKMTWANAMLSDGALKKGTAKPGDIVQDTQEGSMFVWIPRYAYSIDEYKTEGPGDEANGTTQGITTVEFLKGNTNVGSSGTEYPTDYDEDSVAVGTATPMIVHPAFKFGAKSLTGIWVAKFEASMAEENNNTTTNNNKTDKTIKIVPNAESWRYIQIGNAFTNCLNMKDNDIYNISEGADTHLLKNSEWGAVAYLAASQYGVVPAKNISGSSDSDGKYHSYSAGQNYKSNTNQSTTGNVSGIYDLNGGSFERIAAYYDNGDPNLDNGNSAILTYFYQDADTEFYELSTQYSLYWDRYESSQYEIDNAETIWNNKSDEGNKGNYKIAKDRVDLMKNTKGDAMYEAINKWSFFGRNPANNYGETWMIAIELDENGELKNATTGYNVTYYGNDFTLIGTYNRPFVVRGGNWNFGTNTGIFASYGHRGEAAYDARIPTFSCNVKKMEILKS